MGRKFACDLGLAGSAWLGGIRPGDSPIIYPHVAGDKTKDKTKMKIKTQIQIAIAGALLLACYLFTGCATTPTAGSIVAPLAVQTVAEDGTFAALTKYPELKAPLEAVVVGITNATAGGTLNLGATTITSTLNQLGFGGLAKLPGGELLMDNLTPVLAQIDTQLGTNSIANNTNIIPYLNGIDLGMAKGIGYINQ